MTIPARAPDPGRVDGWVWPARLRPPKRLAETRAGELVVRHPQADSQASPALVTSLRAAAPDLLSIPVAEMVELLGGATDALVSGLDGDAVGHVAANAGMSTAMAAQILDGMAVSWNGETLRHLVAAEFADPRVLDGFVSGGARAIRAAGPGLTLHLGAGTVPGVTVTSMIRALLVKSAVLAKPGAGDVALTVRFAREVQRIDARVGAAVAVQYWPGGAEDWDSWERDVFRAADQVVVYGSDATIESVRARAPASTRLIEHPHRVGVAVVDPGRAPGAAAEAARAAVLFDQRGCVSTQLVFVLGARRAVRRWCASLASELVALEEVLPPGQAGPSDLSALHQLRGRLRMKGAASAGTGSEKIDLWHGERSRWTVVLASPDAFEPSGSRTVWVVAVPDLKACLRALARLAPVLQTVGLAGIDANRVDFARELCGLGVTRVVPLREVPYPEADWMHDGNRPLGELVRWSELR
ncbi:MAG: hypothetical protein F4106_10980 [Gemmatimonadetes bacterium]|nr:hypothetical protein [Gemmatimonadota bacterium]MXX70372.1 hypothetical protein [Gemmatimonadota bacterium]MYC90716.1 hypothetical protein [Gemmatimonadota bacterium]MYG35226.1 hypothetical protein [Gemmatimonadota bacterium]MYJ18540.1 hypothetical protein [Gemmatimonadota bacterium]